MTNNSNCSAPAASASTSVDRSCSVDNILNEMNRSFALCTKMRLFQFYDSACKKGSDINWTSNHLLLNPLSSISSRKQSSDEKSGSWMSSIDFWTARNCSSSSSCPTDTAISTVSAPPYDLYERIGAYSNQLVTENRIVTGITQRLEEKLNHFMSSLKFTTAGIFFGAVAGAAVATGVIVGMMAVTGAIGTLESGYYASFVQVLRRCLGMVPSKPKNANNDDDLQEETDNNSSPSTVVSTNGPLTLLQGNPSSWGSVEEQCKSCFQNITSTLEQQKMGLRDIKRISAYLVAGKCDAATFRKILLEEFSIQRRGESATIPEGSEMPLISLLFVSQLENEKAIMQMEVMASKS